MTTLPLWFELKHGSRPVVPNNVDDLVFRNDRNYFQKPTAVVIGKSVGNLTQELTSLVLFRRPSGHAQETRSSSVPKIQPANAVVLDIRVGSNCEILARSR